MLAGGADINGTGNGLANDMTGNGGDNILNGGAGADTMRGAGGTDIYVVDVAGDRIIEGANAGNDLVRSVVGFALGSNLENLILLGLAAIDGTGNARDNEIAGNGARNRLTGGAGKDDLSGGAGNDVIAGGRGADILDGGLGKDSFVFDAPVIRVNADRIVDFNVIKDVIRLDGAAFTALTAGPLAARAFHVGAAAQDATDRIIYNTSTGVLLYDSDGNGATAAAVRFATLSPALDLTAADFLVF